MTGFIINDLTDLEAETHMNAAIEAQTPDLAASLALELDPDGLDPTLVDNIIAELDSNPEYKISLLEKLDPDSNNGGNTIDMAIEIEKSIASATGRVVPIAVKNIINNYNNGITDIADFTHERFKAQAGAINTATNFSKALKAMAIAERAIDWHESGYDPTEGLNQYLDYALTAIVMGAFGGATTLAGFPPLIAIGLTVGVNVAPYIKAFAEHTANQFEIAVNGLVDLGNALHSLAELTGIGLGELTLGIQRFLESAGLEAAAQGVHDAGEWMAAVWEATGDAKWNGSPLVLDLDGDGVELISLVNSNTYWDIDEDSFAELTGWVSGDDGLLAIDLDGDGLITGHAELFGSLTEDGFSALAVYDTNADGVIDVNDAQFGDLLVWQDVNENGVSDAGELLTLSDLNIVSIDLNASTPYQMFIEGHNISHVSSFTMDDGVNGPQSFSIVDAWFEYDNINTNFVGDYTLDLASLFVTTIRGYGTLPDLHISASIDNDTTDSNSLLSLLQNFSAMDLDDIFVNTESVMGSVRDIMFRWAGVDGVDPDSRNSRGGDMDARELEFLEAITGEPYLQQGFHSDPGSLAGEALELAFDTALYPIAGKLIAQAAGSVLFNDGAYYNPASDTFEGFTGFNQDTLDSLLALSLDANVVTDKTAFWVGVVNTVDSSVGVEKLSVDDLASLNATLFASDYSLDVTVLMEKIQQNIDDNYSPNLHGDTHNGTSGVEDLHGTVGDDHYSGVYGDDILFGGLGNDILSGGSDDDILNGELGNDTLSGDGGDDTFLFYAGHGDDIISDSFGNDKIVFGGDLVFSDLIITRVNASCFSAVRRRFNNNPQSSSIQCY